MRGLVTVTVPPTNPVMNWGRMAGRGLETRPVFSNRTSSNHTVLPSPPSGPSAKKNMPRSSVRRSGRGMGSVYSCHAGVRERPAISAVYRDSPVLSFPYPATSSTMFRSARA